MTKMITSLTEEHRRMTKLLSLLDQEVQSFREGRVLDYELISAILDYLTRVSQLQHHQTEDEIYKWLLIRDPEGAHEIGDLRFEHEKLAFLCETLRQAVANVEQDNELPRIWLVSVANEYRSAHINHIRMEEKQFFPLAKKHLSAGDWQDVEDHIIRESDPEFDRLEHEDLDELRHDILTWHDGDVRL